MPDSIDSGNQWAVPAALEGERVDRAIALITGLSRREVEAMVAAGRVSVGGRAVQHRSRKVRSGEQISVSGPIEPPGPAELVADPEVNVPVVYEDRSLIVVDKPAGLVVHPGAGHREATLVHGLLARYPELAEVGDPNRPGIVHRLDKGTSGLLVVARTESARIELIRQLAERAMTREYTALVSGRMESDRGVIEAPLGRSDTDPTRIRVQAGGRPARTHYEVVKSFSQAVTLIRCRLETGRTHQIRVHLASIGHPLVGDDRYGRRGLDGWKPLPAGRPFLHASALELVHPEDGGIRHFSSPLPADLVRVLGMISTTS